MKEKIKILRNAAISSSGTYLEYSLGLVASIYVARSLGPSDFGHYAFVVWLCGWLMFASNNGLPLSAIRFVAQARGSDNPSLADGIAGQLLRWQYASSFVVSACFVLFVAYDSPADWQGAVTMVAALVCIAVVAKAGYTMLAAIGKGYEEFQPEATSGAIAGVLNVALVWFWSVTDGSVFGYIVIFALLSVFLNLSVRYQLARRGIRPWKRSTGNSLEMPTQVRRHVLLTGGLLALGSLTGRTLETLLLKATASLEIVGFFAISGTLTKGAVDFLTSGLNATLLPFMARAFGRGSGDELDAVLGGSIRVYWFLGLVVAGVGFLATPGLIELMYGPDYAGATIAVQVSLCATGLVLFVAPIHAYQSTADLLSERLRVTLQTLMVNLVVAAALVPSFGLPGALGSISVTYGTYALLTVRSLQKKSGVRLPIRNMGRHLVAAGVSFAAGLFANYRIDGAFEFVPSVALYVILLIPISVLLRCWRPGDFSLAGRVVGAATSSGIGRRVSDLGTTFGSTD